MIAPDLTKALRRIARVPVLLVASDYDGTLSPIVDDPAAALPHGAALTALIELCDLPGVHGLIVSGRSLDVLAHLTGAPDSITLVGTHGAQSEDATSSDPEANRVVRDLTDTLLRIATSHDGATVEPKPLGAALHYRQAKDPDAVLAAVDEIAARSGIRIIQGKMVVEFVVGTGNKGSAVDDHRKINTADGVVFFGDDVTDEDVFAVLRAGDVGVKVGPEDSLAQYRVGDPDGVAEALQLLLSERFPFRR